ncbi:T9SS type A sorting domain-containing protein [Porphyromonas gingivalis]|uniref:T9SS type A sorting domain-containing protein n=2 Tax=Porphyromonas gingivalis TaxID=837 RepID=UPI000CA39E48|nr:T9SS type A sorting domain-containing protein [Porphyromonas gingivalis]AUR48053.1 Por secretion system C-terminal sorting domain [Porphyromonas gingivalis]
MKNQRFLMLLASILVFGSMAFAQVPKGNDKSKDEHILTWALPEELVIDNNSIVATYNSFLTPFNGMTMACASFFDVQDLLPYVGYTINRIDFHPTADEKNYEQVAASKFYICIWGNKEQTEVLYEQALPTIHKEDLSFGYGVDGEEDYYDEPMYLAELETPFVIPAGKALYIGCRVETQEGHAVGFGLDDGPAMKGKGDLVGSYLPGAAPMPFVPLSDIPARSMDANFFIYSRISLGSGTQDILQHRMKVYPNPATTELHVEALSAWVGEQAAVYDMRGRRVSARMVDSEKLCIDIASLPAGVYVLRIGSYSAKFEKR